MNKQQQNVLFVILSLAVGVGLIMFVQAIGHKIFPQPEGIQKGDNEAIRAYIASAPIGALLMVPLSYLVGSLGAELIACRWTKGNRTAMIVIAVLLLAAMSITVTAIPHPDWMIASNFLAILIPLGIGLYLAPSCRESKAN